jgi:hypothetical protein
MFIPKDGLLCFILTLYSNSVFYYNLQIWELNKRCVFCVTCQCY